MTDISKYKNVSLSHKTYDMIDTLRKQLVANTILSRSQTISILVNEKNSVVADLAIRIQSLTNDIARKMVIKPLTVSGNSNHRTLYAFIRLLSGVLQTTCQIVFYLAWRLISPLATAKLFVFITSNLPPSKEGGREIAVV